MTLANMTGIEGDTIPTVAAARVHCGFEPEYAIQFYSRNTQHWCTWDCAYTRIEADNLLTSYFRRFRAEGREWRLAKIVYA